MNNINSKTSKRNVDSSEKLCTWRQASMRFVLMSLTIIVFTIIQISMFTSKEIIKNK